MPLSDDGTKATSNFLFNKLQEYKFRGQGFPACEFELTIEQDLAEHKFPNRNGADVEPMGRQPLLFGARVPMINTISPGPAESWSSPLYPSAFRLLLSNMADKTPGPMQHPELGLVQVVPKSARVRWTGDVSAGVYVDCQWVEATFTLANSDKIFQSQSPIGSALVYATNLDAIISPGNIGPLIYAQQKAVPTPSFADSMRSIQAIGDQITLLKMSAGGQIDQVAYRANAIAQSFATATTVTKTDGTQQTVITQGALAGTTLLGPAALYWPLRMQADGLTTSLYALKQTILTSRRAIGLYPVATECTLAAVCQEVKAQIGDLITLNRGLLRSPVVPQGTIVRYYK